ncbi:hypothetical protein DFH09DRAFT_1069010 [Mycena vulgaris]|nr:hypothetical protein DFH09DRAFT_1069010 [Mycena vulgaris]
MTAGRPSSSHWTLSTATPSDGSASSLHSSARSTSTHASNYPDARTDPRRFAFLQPHRTNRRSTPASATSPPILILKLYRRTRAKRRAKKIAQSSAKAVGEFFHLPGPSPLPLHATPQGPVRVPRKLRRPPPLRQPDMDIEISHPFPSGNPAGFEPPAPQKQKEREDNPSSRAWHLPFLTRRNSPRTIEISAPFPIGDPPAGATRIVRDASPGATRRTARKKPGGPRTPCYVNFSTEAGATVSREVRRANSDSRRGAPLPGWKYCEYSPLPHGESSESSLVHAMSTIVRGKDHPFRAPTL